MRGGYDSIVKERRTTGYVKGGGPTPTDRRATTSSVDESGRFLILENHGLPLYLGVNRGKMENVPPLPASPDTSAVCSSFPVISRDGSLMPPS